MDDFEIDCRIENAIHEAVEAGWSEQRIREAVDAALSSAWDPE